MLAHNRMFKSSINRHIIQGSNPHESASRFPFKQGVTVSYRQAKLFGLNQSCDILVLLSSYLESSAGVGEANSCLGDIGILYSLECHLEATCASAMLFMAL